MAKANFGISETEQLELALAEVEKDIQKNGLSSEQPTKPVKEKKMAKKKSAPTPETVEETVTKKSKKAKVKAEAPEEVAPKSKPAKKAKKEEPTGNEFTAKDLAAEFEITPADLRKALRAIKAEKPGSGWVWPKKTDKALANIKKDLKAYLKDQSSKPKKEKASSKKAEKEPTPEKSTRKSPKKKK